MNILLEHAQKWWEERSFGQRFSLIFLTVALVAVVTYMFSMGTQPDWDVLFDNVSTSDAAAVADHLKENGVLYKLTNGGATILVPKEVLNEMRLEIAEQDLNKDEIGYEKLTEIPISVNQAQQAMWKQRIIQGELARTLKIIKGVKKARVTIAEPERTIFAANDEEPTASVMLTLNPGAKIKQDQIKAIKNLVSHSVPRLKPDQVFVTDQNGISLSDDISQSGSNIDDLKSSQEKKNSGKS